MKKTIKTLGIIGVAAFPTTVLLSCTDSINSTLTNDQIAVKNNIDAIQKLETITNKYGKEIYPSTIKTKMQLEKNISQFHQPTDGVNIEIEVTSWNDIEGSLTVKYIVSKDTVMESTTIKYTEFKHFVLNYLNIPETTIPDVSEGFVLPVDDTTYFIGTKSEGVYYVKLSFEEPTLIVGVQTIQIPMTDTGQPFIPNVNGGWAEKIDLTHYLFGTASDGVYQVELDGDGNLIKSLPVTMDLEQPTGIPSVKNGWAVWIGETNDDIYYLIGTERLGAYRITISQANFEVVKSEQIRLNQIPDVGGGWVQWTDSGNYLIGTKENGVYQIEIELASGTIKQVLPISTAGISGQFIPQVNGGWIQPIDAYHYLIGTASEGVYQVTLNFDTQLFEKATPVSKSGSNINIPDVQNGWSLQVFNSPYYLIGTKTDGIYLIEVDPATRTIISSNQMDVANAQFGWGHQVNLNKFLIATERDGLVVMDSFL